MRSRRETVSKSKRGAAPVFLGISRGYADSYERSPIEHVVGLTERARELERSLAETTQLLYGLVQAQVDSGAITASQFEAWRSRRPTGISWDIAAKRGMA